MAQPSSTVGYTSDYNPVSTCTGFGNAGPDRVFAVTIPVGQRLTSAVTPLTSGFDPSIYILAGPATACSTPVCLDGDDSGSATAVNTVTHDNTGTAPLDVFIVVDTTATTGGDFSLTSTLAPIPAGPRGTDTCNPANPITTDVAFMGEDLATATNDYDWSSNPGCVTSGFIGPDRAYPVVLAPDTQVTVNVARTTGSFSPSLQVVTSCPAASNTCLASSNARNPNDLSFRNRTGAPLSFFVVVDASTTATGLYDISFAFGPIPPTPPGDVCTLPLAAGPSVVGSTVGFDNNYTTGTGCASLLGRDAVFTVSVPPGERMVTTVVSTFSDGGTSVNPTLSLIAGTDAGACTAPITCAASASFNSNNVESLAWFNATDAGASFFLVLDTTSSTDPGQLYTLTTTFAAPPQGDRCENPFVLPTNGMPSPVDLATAVNDYALTGAGCTSLSTQGDVVFAVTVPANSIATITAQPDATLNTTLSLARTAADCAARVCIATANTGTSNGALDTISYTNTTASPETVLVIVDTSTLGGGSVDVSATVAPIPQGDTCSQPIAFADGGTLIGERSSGFTNDYTSTGSIGCSLLLGRDAVYAVSIPPGRRGVMRGSPDAGADVSLNLIPTPAANCVAPRTCVASVNGFSSTALGDRTEVLTRFNTSTTAEDYFLIVDTQTAGGDYDLSLTFDTPPVGDRCDAPLALTTGAAINGDFASFLNDYSGTGSSCSSISARADVVYSITVPGDSALDLTVTPGAGLDTSISVATSLAACNTRTCVANASGTTGNPDTLRVLNRSTVPQQYFVIVDHTTIGAVSTFTISAAITPAASGEYCSLATPLPALPVSGETLGGFTNDYGGGGNCASGTFSGADRVYTVSMAPGRTVLTIQPDAGMGISASIVDGPSAACEATPRACVAGADLSTSTGVAERIGYSNTSASPRNVFLIVDTATVNAGLFSVSQTTGPLVPGEDCATAEVLTPDAGTLFGQTTGGFDSDLAGTTANGCVGSTGRDRVYSVSIPPGARFNAFVQPDAGYNPALDLMVGANACAERRCEAAANSSSSSGVAETLGWTNTAGAPVAAWLSVDGTTTATTGAGNFDLTTWFSTPAPGETCANAIPVVDGTALSATTAGFSREITIPVDDNGCEQSLGRDVVYVASVPDGETLTVALTGVAGDVSLNLIAGRASSCGYMPTCVASSNVGGTGVSETAVFTNDTGALRLVFIVIANVSATSTVEAGFTMNVTLN